MNLGFNTNKYFQTNNNKVIFFKLKSMKIRFQIFKDIHFEFYVFNFYTILFKLNEYTKIYKIKINKI